MPIIALAGCRWAAAASAKKPLSWVRAMPLAFSVLTFYMTY